MFTGIVEDRGVVKELKQEPNLTTIKVATQKFRKDVELGESIAVDGVCLTVTRIDGGLLEFDLMKETLDKSTLANIKENQKVNLERALKMTDRLSGHFVTGHIDGVATIVDVIEGENYKEMRFSVDDALKVNIVPKGSIGIDGISLTVGEVHDKYFSAYLIPYTDQVTTLGEKNKGDRVNIETDILAKYVLNKVSGVSGQVSGEAKQ